MTPERYPCLGVPANGACRFTPTYPARECTSGAAWWGSRVLGKAWPEGWGNADNWPAAARAAGFTVNGTCALDTVMCIPPNTNGAGPKGHVAFVTGTPVAGRVSIVEMNFLIEFGYDVRNAEMANCEYIHIAVPKPPPDPPPPPIEEEDVLLLVTVAGSPNTGIWLFGNGNYTGVASGPDETALRAAGAKDITVSATQHERWRAAYPQGAPHA